MDNLIFKKMGWGRPPRHTLVFKIWYIHPLFPDYKNTNLHYRKMVFTKKKSGHAEYLKKKTFFDFF